MLNEENMSLGHRTSTTDYLLSCLDTRLRIDNTTCEFEGPSRGAPLVITMTTTAIAFD
jgi:hypothetical protein